MVIILELSISHLLVMKFMKNQYFPLSKKLLIYNYYTNPLNMYL